VLRRHRSNTDSCVTFDKDFGELACWTPAVIVAYGWPAGLTDEEILERLLA